MKYRVYYNNSNDWPLIWQIDEGTARTHWIVRSVVLIGVIGVTKTNMKADNLSEPKCWIEVRGFLDIADQIAIIRGKEI